MIAFYSFCENGEVKYTVFVKPRLDRSGSISCISGAPRKCKQVIVHDDKFTQLEQSENNDR
jgi:hypothetical protein